MTNLGSCGGCREGNKTNEEIEKCIKPCYNLSYPLAKQNFVLLIHSGQVCRHGVECLVWM